jgi:hypothetical protein
MHLLALIVKYHPHLELQWLVASLALMGVAVATVDITTIVLSLIGAVVAITTVYFTYQTAKLKTLVGNTNTKVDEYHKSVNSKMDKLLEVVKAAALAEGHMAGVEAEKARQALQDLDRRKGRLAGQKEEKDRDKDSQIERR